MHAPPADVWLSIRGGRVADVAAVAGADARVVGLGLASPFGLVEGRGRDEVLYDGAVDDEFMGRSLGAGGCRLGYKSS